jgi:sec-independent protein translocase protein TatA
MPNIGPMEIAIVLIIALVVFGPSKLPELGKSAGKGSKPKLINLAISP